MADATIALCQCGCGLPVTIAQRSTALVKRGEPNRFRVGHRAAAKEHPRCVGRRVVHRLRADLALGHALPPKACVHHPDEDPRNPRARLVICEDDAYHKLLHQRTRVVRAGGNPNTDAVCSRCRLPKPFSEISSSGLCHPCASAAQCAWVKRNRAAVNAANRKRRAERQLTQTSR